MCNSTEDMKAAFEAFNKHSDEIKKKCRIVSMDIKALYPSMTWDDIVQAVLEMIENSNLNIEDVNWREVGKYVAVFVPSEVIEAQGLKNVVPKSNCQPGRARTINFLQSVVPKSNCQPGRARTIKLPTKCCT